MAKSDLAVNLGLGVSSWKDGEANATIRLSPEQSESDGSVPFGSLAAIADNNNASANINSANWDDNSILIEVAYQATRAARGTVEVRSFNSAYNELMGIAQGVMLDDEGPFGQCQSTSVTVPGRPTLASSGFGSGSLGEPQVDHVSFPWESDLTPAPIDVYLKGGLRLIEGGAIYTSQLDAGWSSGYGSLHGGAIGLLITRAMRYAAIAMSPPNVEQVPISFNINYVAPGDGGPRTDASRCTCGRLDHQILHPRGRIHSPLGQAGLTVPSHSPAGSERLRAPPSSGGGLGEFEQESGVV